MNEYRTIEESVAGRMRFKLRMDELAKTNQLVKGSLLLKDSMTTDFATLEPEEQEAVYEIIMQSAKIIKGLFHEFIDCHGDMDDINYLIAFNKRKPLLIGEYE